MLRRQQLNVAMRGICTVAATMGQVEQITDLTSMNTWKDGQKS